MPEAVGALRRIHLHVVELVGPVGMSQHQLPAVGADGATGFKFVEHGIIPDDFLPREDRGEIAAGGLRLGWHLGGQSQMTEDTGQEIVIAHEGVARRPGGDAPRLMEDVRNLHHQLVRSDWSGVVAHAPQPVLAAHPTLVGSVNNERVFSEAVTLEGRHNFTHAVVHAADFGGHAPDRIEVIVVLFQLSLPRVHRLTRKRRQFLVGVVGGMTIPSLVAEEAAEGVGAVVGEKQKERARCVLLDECDAAPRPEVRGVAGFGAHGTVLDHFLIIKFLGVAVGFRCPEAEALRRREIGAEVPLTTEPARVAGITQDFAEGSELLERVVSLRPHHEFRVEKRVHPVLRGHEAGEKCRTRGRAHGVAAERTREAQSVGRETVDVGRADILVAITTERPRALVVGQNEDEIHRLGRRRGANRQRQRKREEGEEEAGHKKGEEWGCGRARRGGALGYGGPIASSVSVVRKVSVPSATVSVAGQRPSATVSGAGQRHSMGR